MTVRPIRPGEWETLGEHEQRIRVLEASPGGQTSSASLCCITPLDGLTTSECSVDAGDGPQTGSFSINTAGQFFNMQQGQSPDYFPIDDTCEGQALYVRGYIENCTGFPVVGLGVQFSAVNVAGTHSSNAFKILPDSNPSQGAMLPWTPVSNLFSQSGESPLGIRIIIDFISGATPGPGIRTGDYWFEFAWFDQTSVQNPALADSPVNPGTEFGQLARWNGVAWEPFPNGTGGQVLTMSGGVPTWV